MSNIPQICIAENPVIAEYCAARWPEVEVLVKARNADVRGKIVAGKIPQHMIPLTKKYLLVDIHDSPPKVIPMEIRQRGPIKKRVQE